MSARFEQFKDLHSGKDLFILPNVWNAKSAAVFQEQGFRAVATSSFAVAESLGYSDGEGMPFSDYLFIIRRILSAIKIPLSVDIEMGYAATKEGIYENIHRLAEEGVVGINIEDSAIGSSGRVLKDAKTFGRTLEFLRSRLEASKIDLFINVRCDTFILDVPNKEKETKERMKIYEDSGADGIFLPCIRKEEDILAAVNNTRLPLNVMYLPGLPGWDVLQGLGVSRVSMGAFLFNKAYALTGELVREMVGEGTDISVVLPVGGK